MGSDDDIDRQKRCETRDSTLSPSKKEFRNTHARNFGEDDVANENAQRTEERAE
jgi:hypothetical protein